MHVQLTIPRLSNSYKLYVYCSKNPEDINTISKVKAIQPTIIIDEAVATSQLVNGRDCYVVQDSPNYTQPGVTYNGPMLNLIPTLEYESSIDIVKINDYTYVNKLVLTPLPLNFKGTMVYYSVIGVDEVNNLITHLSKVNGILMESPFLDDGMRHIYACDNHTATDADVWKYVGACSFDETIELGDISNQATFNKYGIPFVEQVPIFEGKDVNVVTKSLAINNHIVLEIPNPWKKGDPTFNLRKLKSYKIQTVLNSQCSEFSEPTFQSRLPVPIEKMVVLCMRDAENPNSPIPIPYALAVENAAFDICEIIRKDGIYYNAAEHRKLSLNPYNISVTEKTAVFSESSTQDCIKLQFEATPAHTYKFTIYLFDIYGKVSEPAYFFIQV